MTNTTTTDETTTAEQLSASASERRFRIVENAKTGRRALQRQNHLNGVWKLDSHEGSASWRAAMDMIDRGWAVLVVDETPAGVAADEMVCEGSRRAGRDLMPNAQPWVKARYVACCKVCERTLGADVHGTVFKHTRHVEHFKYA